MKKTIKMYFETQSTFSNDCGVCALNNLLGWQQFDNKYIASLCIPLSDKFINPYKSMFGGDFDVTPLILALKNIGLHV